MKTRNETEVEKRLKTDVGAKRQEQKCVRMGVRLSEKRRNMNTINGVRRQEEDLVKVESESEPDPGGGIGVINLINGW